MKQELIIIIEGNEVLVKVVEAPDREAAVILSRDRYFQIHNEAVNR